MTLLDREVTWQQHLRGGGTTTWLQWRAQHPGAVPGDEWLSAAQLEVVRRLAAGAVQRDFAELADWVWARPAAGLGLVDQPPAGYAHPHGAAPVEPDAVPPAELLRVVLAALMPLLPPQPAPVGPPTRGERVRDFMARHGRSRPGFEVYGADLTAATIRQRLRACGWRDGGPRPLRLIVALPIEVTMRERWTARTLAGAHAPWAQHWRRAQSVAAVPTPPPHLANAITVAGPNREQVVATALTAAGVVDATVLGPTPAAAAVEARRRLNVIAPDRWIPADLFDDPRLASRGDVLAAPPQQRAWAQQVAAALPGRFAQAGYPVMGDVTALSQLGPATPSRPDLGLALDCSLTALRRAWRESRPRAIDLHSGRRPRQGEN